MEANDNKIEPQAVSRPGVFSFRSCAVIEIWKCGFCGRPYWKCRCNLKTDKCKLCGKRIYLIKTGKGKETYKWVTDPDKPTSWTCKVNIDFPLRSHSPENKNEDN
jgi:hypothetical protein